ncbi:DNA-directed RNA polymerase III subunit Rpc5 [Elaphomyces granulatus]
MTAMEAADPVVASYDVYLTESDVSRYVLQYVDRPAEYPYDEQEAQKPTALRLKPHTGLVEVDIPISTGICYDTGKGLKYGDALANSRTTKDGGAYGMAGGFASGGPAARGRAKIETEDVEMRNVAIDEQDKKGQGGSLLSVQTLGGRIKESENGDPLYMLGAFRGNNLHLSPVSAVVQLRPQLHHLDAVEEAAAKGRGARARKDMDEDGAPEARVIDMKVKSADGRGAPLARSIALLKKMQEEKWQAYDWVDSASEDAWFTYENYMINNYPEGLPQLESAITGEDYLDEMSAPRIDPAQPGQNRKRYRVTKIDKRQASDGEAEDD